MLDVSFVFCVRGPTAWDSGWAAHAQRRFSRPHECWSVSFFCVGGQQRGILTGLHAQHRGQTRMNVRSVSYFCVEGRLRGVQSGLHAQRREPGCMNVGATYNVCVGCIRCQAATQHAQGQTVCRRLIYFFALDGRLRGIQAGLDTRSTAASRTRMNVGACCFCGDRLRVGSGWAAHACSPHEDA
jgi:hypothetical protein